MSRPRSELSQITIVVKSWIGCCFSVLSLIFILEILSYSHYYQYSPYNLKEFSYKFQASFLFFLLLQWMTNSCSADVVTVLEKYRSLWVSLLEVQVFWHNYILGFFFYFVDLLLCWVIYLCILRQKNKTIVEILEASGLSRPRCQILVQVISSGKYPNSTCCVVFMLYCIKFIYSVKSILWWGLL